LKGKFEMTPSGGGPCLTLTAVLFVGGLSRRMGTDKATLDFADEPLWARQMRLLRDLKPAAVCLSARVRPAWCPPGIETVLDEPPSRGPLSGLAAALRHMQTSHLLALAIDLPQMTLELLLKLWSLAQLGRGVVPCQCERFEPLTAIYPAEAAAVADMVLASGDVSLQHFAQALLREGRIQPYPLTGLEEALFHNVNTPEDLQKCKTVR
jgi:molybdopterin-guanine dinucleotide biosynthesis protein A